MASNFWENDPVVESPSGRNFWESDPIVGAPEKDSGFMGRAGDYGLTAIKGAISVPEAVVGLADMVTGGYAGKALEELGFRPEEAKAFLDENYSDAQKLANANLNEAQGFLGKAAAAVKNPSTVAHAIIESLPAMGAGGLIGRGLVQGAKVAPWAAGAIGEGVVGGGLAAEQIRQQSDTGTLSPMQTGAALASGAGTAALGALGGKLASKFGWADIDTVIAKGGPDALAADAVKKGFLRRVAESGISEGFFEEMPQSMQEQIWQNAALDKPLMEGVAESGAMGLVTGGVMGGVGGGFFGAKPQDITAKPQPTPDDIIAAPDVDTAIQTFTDSLDGSISGLSEDNTDLLDEITARASQEPAQPIVTPEASLPPTQPIQEAQNGKGLLGATPSQTPDSNAVRAAGDVVQARAETGGINAATLGRGAVVGDGLATAEQVRQGSPEGVDARLSAGTASAAVGNVNQPQQEQPSVQKAAEETAQAVESKAVEQQTPAQGTIKVLSDGRYAAVGFTREQIRAANPNAFIDGKGTGIFPAKTNKIQLERALGISNIPEGTILADGDQPFVKRKQALMVLNSTKGMKKTHKIIPVDGGYAIAPLAKDEPAVKTEVEVAERNAVINKMRPASRMVAMTDERLANNFNRTELENMKAEFGWAERGGKLIRGMDGEAVSRTKWIPIDERRLWESRPKGVTEAEAQGMVDDALNGKPLSAAGHRFINYLLDVAQEREKQLSALEIEAEKAEDNLTDAENDALDSLMIEAESLIGSEETQNIYDSQENYAVTEGVRAWYDALTFALQNQIEFTRKKNERTGQTQQAVAGVAEEGGQAGRTENGAQGDAEDLSLASYTEEDLAQREAAQAAQERAQQAEEDAVKAEQAKKDKAAVDAKKKAHAENPENFVFGESKKDAVKPMGSLWDQQAHPPARPEAQPAEKSATPKTGKSFNDYLIERWDRAGKFGLAKIKEETTSALAGITIGREFGESVEDYYKRRPDVEIKVNAYRAFMDGKKPEAAESKPTQEQPTTPPKAKTVDTRFKDGIIQINAVPKKLTISDPETGKGKYNARKVLLAANQERVKMEALLKCLS